MSETTAAIPPAAPKALPEPAAPKPVPQPEGLALAKSFDELEMIEEQLLATRLAGKESVETFLYVVMPSSENKLPKPVVGPTADFVQQLVRRMNRASKGKIDLQLAPEAPVVTDFSSGGKERVRVTVTIIDKATGEVRHGMKESIRMGVDPVNVAYTKAIRRGFEIHPSYNRKTVARFLKEKLRDLGYDPKDFIVVGERGGGQWDAFFAMGHRKGVKPDTLREAVREQTGKGLSEVQTATEADRAAQVMTETIEKGGTPGEPRPAERPPDEGQQRSPQGGEEAQITELSAKCEEIKTQLHLNTATFNALKRSVFDPKQRVENYARLFVAMSRIAAGEDRLQAVAAAEQSYPKTSPDPAPEPAGAQP